MQRSMRSILLSPLQGYADTDTWDLRYVEVDPDHSAASKVVIDQKCNLLRALYRPGSSEDSRWITLCVAGGQQIFKFLSASFVDSEDKSETDPAASFARWSFTLIRGFQCREAGPISGCEAQYLRFRPGAITSLFRPVHVQPTTFPSNGARQKEQKHYVPTSY